MKALTANTLLILVFIQSHWAYSTSINSGSCLSESFEVDKTKLIYIHKNECSGDYNAYINTNNGKILLTATTNKMVLPTVSSDKKLFAYVEYNKKDSFKVFVQNIMSGEQLVLIEKNTLPKSISFYESSLLVLKNSTDDIELLKLFKQPEKSQYQKDYDLLHGNI